MYPPTNNQWVNAMSEPMVVGKCCTTQVNCFMSVTMPMHHWFAVIEHNKGTAVWVVIAETLQDAHKIVRQKAQSMYSGLDWDLKITKLGSESNMLVGLHEVRFDNGNREA